MSTAADDQFYREYILDHFKNPRNYGRLESPDISHEKDNPLGGDGVGMGIRIKGGVIDDGYDVVDVREDWEWNKGHVPGAKHVVLSSILANPTAQKFQDRTVFVCQAGERSAVASEMAVALGVKDVVNFRGGTKAWKDAGLPLEKP